MMAWFWTAWGFLKSLTGGGLVKVVKNLIEGRRDAETQRLAILSNERIEYGRTAADYHKDANKYHSNRWIRPVLIAPFAIYIWAYVVFDKVLGLVSIDPLNAAMFGFMTLIGSFFFGWRPVENFAKDLMGMNAHSRESADGWENWDAGRQNPPKRGKKRKRNR